VRIEAVSVGARGREKSSGDLACSTVPPSRTRVGQLAAVLCRAAQVCNERRLSRGRGAAAEMTMMHLMNCLLLTYGPFVVTYRSSKLADYSPFQSCFMSGLIFAATALCKILFMAVFLPASAEESHGFSWAQESGKLIANVVCVSQVSAPRSSPPLPRVSRSVCVRAHTHTHTRARAAARWPV
jgi:hypothetical protein